jgi:hypothetical protein
LQKFIPESNLSESLVKILPQKQLFNIETQTEWSWIQDLQVVERIKKGFNKNI